MARAERSPEEPVLGCSSGCCSYDSDCRAELACLASADCAAGCGDLDEAEGRHERGQQDASDHHPSWRG